MNFFDYYYHYKIKELLTLKTAFFDSIYFKFWSIYFENPNLIFNYTNVLIYLIRN